MMRALWTDASTLYPTSSAFLSVLPEHLALAEPLSCCVYGQRRLPIDLGDTVLVLGAGPIGLFHLQLALLSGARTVIVSQRSESRRRMAS